MNISLTPKLEELVKAKVASGKYNSASEVVREALRLLEEQDELHRIKLEALKRDIMTGMADLEADRYKAYASAESCSMTSRSADDNGLPDVQRARSSEKTESHRPAQDDLLEIWSFIAQDDPTAADNLLAATTNQFDRLLKFPELGRERNELLQDLRNFAVNTASSSTGSLTDMWRSCECSMGPAI
jgi:antitoxin ParD1/3/4